MCRARTDPDPEFAGAAKHRTDADRFAATAIAELVGLSVHAMKAQELSQGLKPEICRVGIPILDRHIQLNPSRLPTASMFLLMHSQTLMVPHPGAEAADRLSMPSIDGMERLDAEADQWCGLVRNES
jgi:hypothetical protein